MAGSDLKPAQLALRWLAALCGAGLVQLASPALAQQPAVEATFHAAASGASGVPTRSLAQPRSGTLFRVVSAGRIHYLFGTVHVGQPSFAQLSDEVSQAVRASGQLVLELDVRSDAAFQAALSRHGMFPDGDHVSRHISPVTLRRLRAVLHGHGVTLGSVARLKPWLIANVLVGYELQRHGYERTHGTEVVLLAERADRNEPVGELESADYQLAVFDQLNDEESERYLVEALDELESGIALSKSKALLDAWQRGDADALEAAMKAVVEGPGVTASFTRRVLLGKRNGEMAQRIDQLLRSERTSFVGVGFMHLLGQGSVPELLAQRGYTVERVY